MEWSWKWNWSLSRHRYLIGDVNLASRKACERFSVNADDVVPSLIAAIMMSDGNMFSSLVDAYETVSVEAVEDAIDRMMSDMPDGDSIAQRINETLDEEAERAHSYDLPVVAEL